MERFFSYIRNLIDHYMLWIPIVLICLLVYVFLLIVNRNMLREILSKVARVIAKGYKAVLGFFDNTVEAIKSASHFMLSIRMLLFKSQNQKVTTHVLHSSIFFLSIVSYMATYSSMKQIVNTPIALFLTFSIQATIVALGVSIGAKNPPFDKIGVKNSPSDETDANNSPFDKAQELKKKIKRVVYVFVLVFCMCISIFFSKAFIMNQIDSRAYTIKSELLEEIETFNGYAKEIDAMLFSYELTDQKNVAMMAELLSENSDLIGGSDDEKQAEVATLIKMLDTISKGCPDSENSDCEDYDSALTNIDVGMVKNAIAIIRKNAIRADISQEQEDEAQKQIEEEKNDIEIIFRNLRAINSWKKADKKEFNEQESVSFDVSEMEDGIEEQRKGGTLNQENAEKKAYFDYLEKFKQTISDKHDGLPMIDFTARKSGYQNYDVRDKYFDERKGDLDNLKESVIETANPVGVSPTNAKFFRRGTVSRQTFRLSLLLSIGIDFTILLLCLCIEPMDNGKLEQEQVALMREMTEPQAEEVSLDLRAVTLNGIFTAGVLFIIIMNLFEDFEWEQNFMMGFALLLIVLILSLIFKWHDCRKKDSEQTEKLSAEENEKASKIISKLKKKMCLEIQTLLKGIEFDFESKGLERNDKETEWLAYKPYDESEVSKDENLQMVVAFLSCKKLINIKENYILYTKTFIDLLLRIAMDKSDDDDFMEDQLKNANGQP